MIDTITAFFLEKWPELTVGGILIITAFIAGIRTYKYHINNIVATKKECADTTQKINSLPCSSHESEIAKFNDDFGFLKKSVTSTNDMLLEVTKWIMHFDDKTIDTFVKKASPYKLTKIGSKILDESKGAETIDDNTGFFLEHISNLNPKTPYDVENYAMDVILRNIGNGIFDNVKNYVYYSPESKTIEIDGEPTKVKIALPQLLRSMSIYLRDKYFEHHPEIENHEEWKMTMSHIE